jgi:hypothetical protein
MVEQFHSIRKQIHRRLNGAIVFLTRLALAFVARAGEGRAFDQAES